MNGQAQSSNLLVVPAENALRSGAFTFDFDAGSEDAPKLRYRSPAPKPKLIKANDRSKPGVWWSIKERVAPKAIAEAAVWSPAAPSPAGQAFHAIQRWEGSVLECLPDAFSARLSDLTAGGPQEEVELPISDVSDEDLPLVAPGAVFYWSIGYQDGVAGQRSRLSALRFRRLPVWSEGELVAAKERASDVAKVFAAT